MQLFGDYLKGQTHEAWYNHVSYLPMVQPDCQKDNLVKLYCEILWPLYTCIWFKLGLQIEIRVPLANPKHLINETPFGDTASG